MTLIFVSHSKFDYPLLGAFSKSMALAGIKIKLMEFEDLDKSYAGYIITDIIKNECDGLAVLLGDNILNPPGKRRPFTRNWVTFETGVSSGSGKRVWVLEESMNKIYFPIPYVTDYVLIKDINDIKFISKIFEDSYKNKENENQDNIGYLMITCPFPGCNAEFNLWSDLRKINCPVCRRKMVIEESSRSSHISVIKANVKIPKATLWYENREYPLRTHYRLIKKELEKFSNLSSPHRGDPVDMHLRTGDKIIFQFQKPPSTVIPLLVDFDGDVVSYWYIDKNDECQFVLDFRRRIPNHHLQVYTLFSKSRIAYSKYITVECEKDEYSSYKEIDVVSIRASNENQDNRPTNVLDYEKEVYWIGKGNNSWIECDLGKKFEVNFIEIKWFDNFYLKFFDVSLSDDGVNFNKPMLFASERATDEEYFFIEGKEPKYGRFVRLNFKYNVDNIRILVIKIHGLES